LIPKRGPGPTHFPAHDQLLLFINGGPGVGKSYFAHELVASIDSSMICCVAPTGIAASQLFKGRTLHDLLGLPISTSSSKVLPQLRLDKAAQLTVRLHNVRLLLIDELSMVDHLLFSWVDQRLQQLLHKTLPFGGLGIILMGDMLQLSPVCGSTLYKSALKGSSPGGLLFQRFELYTFQEKMRAATDTAHTYYIYSFRNLAHPVTSDLSIVTPSARSQ